MDFAWIILLSNDRMAAKTPPSLSTERLLLRPFLHPDSATLYHVLNHPDVWRYFPRTAVPTLEQTSTYIKGQFEHWDEYGLGHWALEDKNQTLLGWCGLQFLPDTNETEVAYCLGKAHWGKGYATEAARASLEYGIFTLEKKEIIGLTHIDNRASQNVLLKIGLSFIDQKHYFGMDCCRFRITV